MPGFEVEEKVVVECAHCKGTGTCKAAEHAGHSVSCHPCKSEAGARSSFDVVICSSCGGAGKKLIK
jgi:hypothetical protein